MFCAFDTCISQVPYSSLTWRIRHLKDDVLKPLELIPTSIDQKENVSLMLISCLYLFVISFYCFCLIKLKETKSRAQILCTGNSEKYLNCFFVFFFFLVHCLSLSLSHFLSLSRSLALSIYFLFLSYIFSFILLLVSLFPLFFKRGRKPKSGIRATFLIKWKDSIFKTVHSKKMFQIILGLKKNILPEAM